jgi:glycosyltransferase involved in cell wall biosynthesis
MYKHHKISVIMPCRNEGSHLEHVVARVPKFVDEIIIVSNRSTDNTVDEAKRLGLKVFEDDRAIKGIGYGFAHMTGIANATGDILAGIDGDATYPIEELNKIIDHLLKQKLDFVSCNRAGTSKQRYFKTGMSHLLWIFANRFGLGANKAYEEA